jgi:proteic killer suppression protein
LTLNHCRDPGTVIRSFRCRETEKISPAGSAGSFRPSPRGAKRKLDQLDSATSLRGLAGLPGNRLEALAGDRAGQYSIRINDQWRLYFCWKDGEAHDVEIVDYH